MPDKPSRAELQPQPPCVCLNQKQRCLWDVQRALSFGLASLHGASREPLVLVAVFDGVLKRKRVLPVYLSLDLEHKFVLACSGTHVPLAGLCW